MPSTLAPAVQAPHPPLALVLRLARRVHGIGAHAAGTGLGLAFKAVVMQPEVAAGGHLERLQALALLAGGQGRGKGWAGGVRWGSRQGGECGMQRRVCSGWLARVNYPLSMAAPALPSPPQAQAHNDGLGGFLLLLALCALLALLAALLRRWNRGQIKVAG